MGPVPGRFVGLGTPLFIGRTGLATPEGGGRPSPCVAIDTGGPGLALCIAAEEGSPGLPCTGLFATTGCGRGADAPCTPLAGSGAGRDVCGEAVPEPDAAARGGGLAGRGEAPWPGFMTVCKCLTS